MTVFPSLLFAILIISGWGGGMVQGDPGLEYHGLDRYCPADMRARCSRCAKRSMLSLPGAYGVTEGRIITRHLMPNAVWPS